MRIATMEERSFWLFEQLSQKTGAYNMAFQLVVAGNLSEQKVRAAAQAIPKEHPVFLSSFKRVGEDVQVTQPTKSPEVVCQKFEANTDAQLRSIFDEFAYAPFNLSEDALLRIGITHCKFDGTTRLFFILHHLACDATSMHEIFRSFWRLYENPAHIHSSGVQPQRDGSLNSSERSSNQREVFEDRLGVSNLSFGRVDKLEADGRVYFEIGQERLRAFKTIHISGAFAVPSAKFLALYCIMLSSFSGEDDLQINLAIDTRDPNESPPRVGTFVRTIPLRIKVDWCVKFNNFAAKLAKSIIGAVQKSITAEEQTWDQSIEAASASGSSSILFNHRSYFDPNAFADGLYITSLPIPTVRSQCSLSLIVEDGSPEGECYLEYDGSELKHQTAEGISEAILDGIDRLLEKPDCSLSDLVGNPPEIAHRMMEIESDNSERSDLLTRISASLKLNKRATVSCSERALSFEDLDLESAKLASRLSNVGLRAKDIIAIKQSDPLDTLIAVIAAMKLGCVYCVLDPYAPLLQVESIIAQINPSVVLADQYQETPGTSSRILFQTLQHMAEASGDDEISLHTSLNKAPVYVSCTSGSTGQRKAVLTSYGALSSLTAFYGERISLSKNDRILIPTGLHFDLSQKNLFVGLLSGSDIRFINDVDARELAREIKSFQPTLLNSTPSLIFQAVEFLGAEFSSSLKSVVFGGEPLMLRRLKDWYARYGSETTFYNSYGPTECSGISTWKQIEAEDFDCWSVCPLGDPLPGARVIVSKNGYNACRTGEVGEVWIGGRPVSEGYLGDPLMTADRFLPDYAAIGQRLYRTGDIARREDNGALCIYGRADSQVKINGNRIDFAEIEDALSAHPSVQQCAIFKDTENESAECLTAYITCTHENVSFDELRSHLEHRIPRYAVPSRFAFAEFIALTPNGKVDRRQAPTVKTGDSGSHRQQPQPKTIDDGKLDIVSDIWREELCLNSLCETDNFFQLGGHSMSAIRILWKIEETLGLVLTPTELYDAPTLKQFKLLIEKRQQTAIEVQV